MTLKSDENSSLTRGLLDQIRQQDEKAWDTLLRHHEQRLLSVVRLRLDRRLQGRVSPSDVVQEAFLEATQRLPAYLDRQDMPFYFWLRFLTMQRLLIIHRRHLQTESRNASREIPLRDGSVDVSSEAVAEQFMAGRREPLAELLQKELQTRLQKVLDGLEPVDREILTLRHFEELSNREVSELLGISTKAASQRYARALLRLKDILKPSSE